MNTPPKPFSILLAFLLALTPLAAPGALVLPAASRPAQAAQQPMPGGPMPDDLMRAFLAASAQPFEASADGYRARSGGLDFTLRAGGLQASGHGLAWGLALNNLGRGKQTAPLPQAQVVQAEDRLEYRRGALTEWYRDTPLGMEQGFTVHQAPPGKGLLLLRLDLAAAADATADADGRGLSFALPGGQALRYDHLRAWDADGAPLETHLRCASGQVMLQVDDRGAAYPITIDPLIYLEQKVIAADGAADDYFGGSVALSGDTALVGAPGANADQGSAYVFVRSGTTWGLQQKLTAADGAADDRFGDSVALSGDTALVGADWADSAYVFVRSGTTWTQQAQLTAADGEAGDSFGISVALSGNMALVGAYLDNVGTNITQGSAYVFVRSGTTWTQQAHLTASDGAEDDFFGVSVALAGDTALVGAYYDDVGANSDQGSAYFYKLSFPVYLPLVLRNAP